MLTKLIISAQSVPPILIATLVDIKNLFVLAKEVISKSLIIFKNFLKQILEFFLYHQIFGFKAMLLLMSLLDYCLTGKQNGKKDLV